MNWHLIDTSESNGFEIKFHVGPEDMHPNDFFDDDGETAAAIDAGQYEWFIAKVTASKAGVKLGADYLGGCCYISAHEFMDCPNYDDMVNQAIAAAKAKLAELQAA